MEREGQLANKASSFVGTDPGIGAIATLLAKQKDKF
jgi:hypothetical protein